jgi:hypothetical protein
MPMKVRIIAIEDPEASDVDASVLVGLYVTAMMQFAEHFKIRHWLNPHSPVDTLEEFIEKSEKIGGVV